MLRPSSIKLESLRVGLLENCFSKLSDSNVNSGLRTTLSGNKERKNRVKQGLKVVINEGWCPVDRRQEKKEKRV